MTTYTTIPNTDIDQDSPITQPLMTALRDNPIATAEGSSGSPVVAAGWHPYDMVNVGDGNDGVFYDFSVDGSVASVASPDFADDYEYMFLISNLSGSTNADLRIEWYKETGAAYTAATAITGITLTAASVLHVVLRMVSPARYATAGGNAIGYWSLSGAGSTNGSFDINFADATVQKVTRVRFSYAAGNIDAGTIKMLRRRIFT